MAFLGGLFGGNKTNSATTQTQGTTVSSDVAVNVGAEFSPEFNSTNTFSPEFAPVNANILDLTGFGEAVGNIAGVLESVAGDVAASQERAQTLTAKTDEKAGSLLEGLSKIGGAATAVLAMMAIYFAIRDPANVKVQL